MRKPTRTVGGWIEDRTGLMTLFSRLLSGKVERHGAWLRTTGLACLVLILVECVTGTVLSVYYTPSPSAAYKTVLAIDKDPLGQFVRGLHHWCSATLIVLALLTVIRMFFGAEYRKRRDVVWIVSLIFLNLVLFFQLTGHLLPWDTNAVATANVEAGFAGNVWVFGTAIKRFLLGGESTGAATLTRWYGFHVALLPALLLLLVGLPLLLHRLRLSRSSEGLEEDDPEEEPAAKPSDAYYPVHMAREMLVALAVFLLVAGLAVKGKAPLELEATAQNLAGYEALSEWYVLPMHALVVTRPFNEVRWEPLATFVIPGALVTVLILLPFLDRNTSRSWRKRPFAMALGSLVLLGAAAGTVPVARSEAPKAEKQAQRIAIIKGERKPSFDAALATRGKELYAKTGCDACHAIGGKGGKAGPDLTKAGILNPDRDWQLRHLAKPDAVVTGSTMPAYNHLKPDELKALAEYMISLSGP